MLFKLLAEFINASGSVNKLDLTCIERMEVLEISSFTRGYSLPSSQTIVSLVATVERVMKA
jgi:hypothetical protein